MSEMVERVADAVYAITRNPVWTEEEVARAAIIAALPDVERFVYAAWGCCEDERQMVNFVRASLEEELK